MTTDTQSRVTSCTISRRRRPYPMLRRTVRCGSRPPPAGTYPICRRAGGSLGTSRAPTSACTGAGQGAAAPPVVQPGGNRGPRRAGRVDEREVLDPRQGEQLTLVAGRAGRGHVPRAELEGHVAVLGAVDHQLPYPKRQQ